MIVDLPDNIKQSLNILDLEKLRGFQFAVQIDGDFFGEQFVAGFSEIRKLGDSITVREVAEGGYRGYHRFPKRTQHPAIQLIRGMTFSRAMFNWFQEVNNWTRGKDDYRRSMSISVINGISVKGQLIDHEAWRLDLFDAWPSAWDGPRLNAMDDSLAFESITIEHSGITEAQGVFSGAAGEMLSQLV